MGKTILAWDNLFIKPSTVITASDSEIMYGIARLFDPKPTHPIRSIYRCCEFRANQNDRLPFDIGGAELNAALDAGSYKWDNSMGHVAQKMNDIASVSNITASRDSTTGIVTIARGSGPLNLKCKDGTTRQRSAWPSLGYSTGSNRTGALTYAGNRGVFSTGGRLEIVNAEKNIRFDIGGSTFSQALTVAVYNELSILGEIKYQMESASGATDMDPYHDWAVRKYHLAKAAGTLNLRFGGGASLANVRLGYNAADATGALDYTADSRRIHSEFYIRFDLGAAYSLALVAFIRHNLSSTATILIKGSADNFATFPYSSAVTWTADNLVKVIDPAQSYRYWELHLTDRDNPAEFIEVGVPCAFLSAASGSIAAYADLLTNYSFGGQIGSVSKSESVETDAGSFYGNEGGDRLEWHLPYKRVPNADLALFQAAWAWGHNVRPFAWFPDNSDLSTVYWVMFQNPDMIWTDERNRWTRTIDLVQFK
jgi:hypothetical protein